MMSSLESGIASLHIYKTFLVVGNLIVRFCLQKMHKVGQLKLDENIQSIEKAQNHKLDSKVVKSIQSAVICQVQDLRRFLIVLLESAIFVIDAPVSEAFFVLCIHVCKDGLTYSVSFAF